MDPAAAAVAWLPAGPTRHLHVVSVAQLAAHQAPQRPGCGGQPVHPLPPLHRRVAAAGPRLQADPPARGSRLAGQRECLKLASILSAGPAARGIPAPSCPLAQPHRGHDGVGHHEARKDAPQLVDKARQQLGEKLQGRKGSRGGGAGLRWSTPAHVGARWRRVVRCEPCTRLGALGSQHAAHLVGRGKHEELAEEGELQAGGRGTSCCSCPRSAARSLGTHVGRGHTRGASPAPAPC